MKIAIVGSGISGLVCAHLLRRQHDVTLFEANDYPGGHTHTVAVELDGERVVVDTGFIVCNDRTYPNFLALLEELGVGTRPTSMGFSVQCRRCGLEYSGASLATLFAQRRNLVRPSHYRMLCDILRFHREAVPAARAAQPDCTLAEFLQAGGYSRGFAEHYLLPMGAAIWSCPTSAFEQFPLRFVIEFYSHHGLLQLRDRPTWQVIEGGSWSYVERITAGLGERLRLNCPVHRIRRSAENVILAHPGGAESFDEVILACHSDQALRLLERPSRTEQEVLGQFPYSDNRAVLHTDASILPRRRSVWSSWNYRIPPGEEQRPGVTYLMNVLQHLQTRRTVCVTLNDTADIAPDQILGEYRYSHPVFTVARESAQQRHGEVIRRGRTSFCGAYWGNGFHEDGVNSALAVCRAFGVRPGWQTDEHSGVASAEDAVARARGGAEQVAHAI